MDIFWILMLALPLLILAAIQGGVTEVANPRRAKDSTLKCTHPHLQEIQDLVQEFNSNRDWAELKRGLEAVLDNSSDVYRQLQSIGYDWLHPLYWIGRRGHSRLALLLLCGGLPVNTFDGGGDTMLHGATARGHLQLVRLLLGRGAHVDPRGSSGDTPLMRAAQFGYLKTAVVLVQAGADTTARDSGLRTALDWATSLGRTELAHYLAQFPH